MFTPVEQVAQRWDIALFAATASYVAWPSFISGLNYAAWHILVMPSHTGALRLSSAAIVTWVVFFRSTDAIFRVVKDFFGYLIS